MKKIILGIVLTIALSSAQGQSKNADSLCVVGKKYQICTPRTGNPFEPQSRNTVTIVDKINGYVKYCLSEDYGKIGYIFYYNRSCKEFIELIEYCN